MNRYDRDLENAWEESWDRTGQNRENGITPVQVLLIVLVVLLLAALIGMGVIFFIF
ncbi:MAG: hypothetical protein LUH07_09675 [Lachnospiraceae bacterium]|nr:hypothetical protein [Lachnospiraceae bacterium]